MFSTSISAKLISKMVILFVCGGMCLNFRIMLLFWIGRQGIWFCKLFCSRARRNSFCFLNRTKNW